MAKRKVSVGKRITAKQKVARRKNIAIARSYKKKKRIKAIKNKKAMEALYNKYATPFTRSVHSAAKKVYKWKK